MSNASPHSFLAYDCYTTIKLCSRRVLTYGIQVFVKETEGETSPFNHLEVSETTNQIPTSYQKRQAAVRSQLPTSYAPSQKKIQKKIPARFSQSHCQSTKSPMNYQVYSRRRRALKLAITSLRCLGQEECTRLLRCHCCSTCYHPSWSSSRNHSFRPSMSINLYIRGGTDILVGVVVGILVFGARSIVAGAIVVALRTISFKVSLP